MRKKISILILIFIFSLSIGFTSVFSSSYLADKAETPIALNNTGARAICQTDDGYVWIGQFAGLNRYDSRELVSYDSFIDDNGETVQIENVRRLADYNNILFMVSSVGLIKFENNKFERIILSDQNPTINDLIVNESGLLYIPTTGGLYTYDSKTNELKRDETHTEDVLYALPYEDKCFVVKENNALYDYDNNLIYDSEAVSSVYYFEGKIAIATNQGKIFFYDISTNTILDKSITLYNIAKKRDDMVHRFIYSKEDNYLFAAAEKGLYSINVGTLEASYAQNLENNNKLVDIMIDYENDLWIASYITGVSIISKSSLVDLLFDVSESAMPHDRLVYATLKYGNDLFMATGNGIYVYDVKEEKIKTDHPLITKINEIIESEKNLSMADKRIPYYDVRDIEIYKGKIYFATYGSGLFEYNPQIEELEIYRGTDINPDDPDVNTKGYYAVAQRCLKAYDDYLFIGTATNSIIRFDGSKNKGEEGQFIYNREISTSDQTPCTNGQILYIDKSAFGDITYVCSGYGIHTINKDLENSSIRGIEGIDETTSGMLKFYQDGDNFFYNIYGRFFCINTKENSAPKEINIPYVNSSITEINKVNVTEDDGTVVYKYVIASEKQIYIIDDLLADEINYEFYDSSNGLKSAIKANSSGFYDEDAEIYYFQSQDGVFTYNFNVKVEEREPLLIDVNSVNVDGTLVYDNTITLDKNADRITFNLSVFSFKPTKGYKIYYKLDGVDRDYILSPETISSVSYTNLSGGKYAFHVYVEDEIGQISNQIDINLTKDKHVYEEPWFWILIAFVGLTFVAAFNYMFMLIRDKQAEKRETELKNITIESIEAIARTIDAKDTYTNGHSIRVGHFSRVIAKELGMEGDKLSNLYYIALLHDIGKIGIPDAILNKPGRLTDEEFAIMKSHTTKGAKILKDISTIPGIVEGAKYHHERYGGGGYPEGLKGEEIPYIARIICCADCFDAMATRRVYKDPYPKDKIISEFERCKGIQFDPEMADVVIRLIKEGKLKAED